MSGLRGLLRGLLVAQFVAREFADRRARQFVDEIERRRNFVLAELAGEECLELVQRERIGAGAQLDKGLRRLAAVIVGNADHDHFLHRGMVIDRLLDHLRIDVEAAGDDHVLLAVDQIEIAVTVHVADIAGQEAVADKGLRGFLRPVPVALGDVRPLDADFADFAGRQDLAWDRRARPRPFRCRAASARSNPACPAPPAGWPVPGEQVSVMPQPLFSFMLTLRSKILRDLDRQRRAARSAADQRRQIAACRDRAGSRSRSTSSARRETRWRA